MGAPTIVWQRLVAPGAEPWVDASGVLVIGEEVLEVATGARSTAVPRSPVPEMPGPSGLLGITDRHVLTLEEPELPELFDGHIGQVRRRGSPFVSPYLPGACDCPEPMPHPDAADACAMCRRQMQFMTFDVYERGRGTLLWRHRWRGAPVVVRGDVALIREGGEICGYALDDGHLLWREALSEPVWFTGRKVLPGSRWAWLGKIDRFVHAASGRMVTLPGAFHQTGDDLVLARTGTTLTCVALPGDS
jgi:hypothetical protein